MHLIVGIKAAVCDRRAHLAMILATGRRVDQRGGNFDPLGFDFRRDIGVKIDVEPGRSAR